MCFQKRTAYAMRISDGSSDVCTTDLLGRTAKLHAQRRDDQRPIDEDRLFHHRIDQLRISEIRIDESQFGKGRALIAKQGERGDAGADDEACQQGTRRRSIGGLDKMRIAAGIAEQNRMGVVWGTSV